MEHPRYEPTAADLREADVVSLIHHLLEVAPDLPPETRWSLADYSRAVLDDERGAMARDVVQFDMLAAE